MSAEGQIIPDDIMKAAEEALDNLLCNCVESCGSSEAVRQASIKEIAMALFCERERCAAIAEHFANSSLHSDWPDDARGAGYYACSDVVQAICNPSPPQQPSALNSDDDLPF